MKVEAEKYLVFGWIARMKVLRVAGVDLSANMVIYVNEDWMQLGISTV